MTNQRIQELIQMLRDEVKSDENFQEFLQKYKNEIDQDFIMAITNIAEQAQVPSGYSDTETEIKVENDAINELRKTNPNAAYTRTVTNLEQAKQIGNDELIWTELNLCSL